MRAALCRATEELCAVRSPGSVGVREVAARARVNHGLIHHYYGSKPALLGATMLMIEQDFANTLAAITDPIEMISALFDGVQERPSYPRLLSWLLLEGVDPTEQIDDFPMVTQLREAIERHTGCADAAARTQVLLAFIAGWSTTREFTAVIAGLEPGQRAESTDLARRHAISMALGDPAEPLALHTQHASIRSPGHCSA